MKTRNVMTTKKKTNGDGHSSLPDAQEGRKESSGLPVADRPTGPIGYPEQAAGIDTQKDQDGRQAPGEGSQ